MMRKSLERGWLLALPLLLLMAGCRGRETERMAPVESDLLGLVDPFIGTGGHGHTFPGAAAPMGMVQLSPETRWEGWDACAGYHYDDRSLYGFAHTHLSGTGCNDLGDLLFIPTTDPELYRDSIGEARLPKLTFSHEQEEAHPGYYCVETESGILAELTATPLMGVHRYSFPKRSGKPVALVVDLVNMKGNETVEASLVQSSANEVCGHTRVNGWAADRQLYFVARFSHPIASAELFSRGMMVEGVAEGDFVRGLFTFVPDENEELEIFVGLSETSVAGARENLLSEMTQWGNSFEEVRRGTEATWTKLLSRVRVTEGRKSDLTTLYTALYHTLLVPSRVSDADGSYRGLDGKIHRREQAGLIRYSTLSLWDTFRAEHPLLCLLVPEVVPDLCRSMMEMYEEQGELPIWPLFADDTRTMIGYHAVSVLWDAYRQGLTGDLDPKEILAAMVRSSEVNRKGAAEYGALGFIPTNLRGESVSCTLEYAYDDWCIARMAEALGDSTTAATYFDRAYNYRLLFDGESRFFRGRYADGSWGESFDPYEVSRDFTEANAWQYRFAPVHDVAGLMALHGGREAMAEALDSLFADETKGGELQDITGLIGQYAHGNEPSHHLAYLYNYLGRPWRTQKLTREIIRLMYSNEPDGIAGNEDCGQMSAWYLLTALGLYPFAPGTGELLLTTPLFREVKVEMPDGTLTITTDREPNEYPYLRSVNLNGRELHRLFVTTEELRGGGTLAFTLSKEPVTDFLIEEEPYSLTRTAFVSPVYSPDPFTLFDGEATLSLATATPGTTIDFAIDDGSWQRYREPITLREGCRLSARATLEGLDPSPVTTLEVTRAHYAPSAGERETEAGACWRLYHGAVESTEEITRLPKVAEGVSPEASIEMRDREELFALVFDGYIEIPERGVYQFRLTSDDGSRLRIDGLPVVDNDGSHAYVSATSMVALDAGLHPFTLSYWQGSEGKGLRLEYRLRGTDKYVTPKLRH